AHATRAAMAGFGRRESTVSRKPLTTRGSPGPPASPALTAAQADQSGAAAAASAPAGSGPAPASSSQSSTTSAPAFDSGSLRFPHLGDCTQEGQPLLHLHPLISR